MSKKKINNIIMAKWSCGCRLIKENNRFFFCDDHYVDNMDELEEWAKEC